MSVADAVRAMGPGALTEEGLRRHVFPLFSKTLAEAGDLSGESFAGAAVGSDGGGSSRGVSVLADEAG